MVKDLTHNGKTYRYDSDAVTTEQMIIVTEIYDFKRQQIAKPPARLDQLRQSGGDDYFQRAVANLLVEVVAGAQMAYTRRHADTEGYDWVCSFPAKRHAELREVIDDFFTMLGRSDVVTDVHERSTMNAIDLLSALSLFPQVRSALALNENLSNASLTNSDSENPENSPAASATPGSPQSSS